ncbi:MAG: ATP-dependent DNA helicase RecG [Syntrophales bacterium]|jgi:ATP-dependent DNA helicase RecG
MDSIIAILDKIEAPLFFSSRKSYRYLPLLKDFETTMRRFLDQLKNVPFINAGGDEADIRYKNMISGFEDAIAGFDRLPLEDKKERIEKAMLVVKSLRGFAAESSIEISHVRQEMEPRDLEQGEVGLEKLSIPLRFVKGVGPKMASLLEKKGLKTVADLLYFVPRRYEDRRTVRDIKSVTVGSRGTVIGHVASVEYKSYRNRKAFEVTIEDGSGLLTAKWFRGSLTYLRKIFRKGMRVIMTGEVTSYLFSKDMVHPDFEVLDDDESAEDLLNFKRIVPIYSETEGLRQKYIRRIMAHAVDKYSQYLSSPIPHEICERRHLQDIKSAARSVHFPATDERIDAYNEMRSGAHRTLIYDEFFFFQLGMALKRNANTIDGGIAFKTQGRNLHKFYKILPFTLTDAQKRVIVEIEGDMERPSSMNRLLQGDVGCGKTVVSMAAMITACENGYQAAIMVPTEILAEQHYNRIKDWSSELDLKAVLLTSRMKNMERKKIFEGIKKGNTHIICGTHALIQKDVTFSRLGLVVIDEQHRFGVVQRSLLRQKGENPDVLVMTATPIPRTLAMTVYGDLDISIIDECPPGRKEIRTKVFFEEERKRIYEIMRMEIMKGNQVFVVYPLVEESENLDLRDATKMADYLQREIFPDHKVGLIHGRMKGKNKEETMAAFLNKDINILVSTTVIEVGIDIPHASLIVIEHAERFGLSQLHQLRGRVGRSDIPSFCILMSHRRGSDDSIRRLQVMEETNDGFKIAEEDLAIRGPGEFMGTRQSGVPDFRIAHILRDAQILLEARTDAFSFAENISSLDDGKYALLKKVLLHRWGGRLELAKTG